MVSFDHSDEVLLEALTHDVRVMSLHQASRLLDADLDLGITTVERLSRSGFVSMENQLVSVDGEVARPIYNWSVGEGIPNFRSGSYLARNRWSTPREQRLLFPTVKACSLYGGSMVRPRSQGETDHDLWMSEVYLHYRDQVLSDQELSWVSGDELRSRGDADVFAGLVPDATLCRSDGSIERIVEGAGRGYQASKLQRLHECYSQHSAYELW